MALARAAYLRAPVILLDDVFSFLDRKTALDVFGRLLGAGGLLRDGTTVLLATYALDGFWTSRSRMPYTDSSWRRWRASSLYGAFGWEADMVKEHLEQLADLY